MNDLKLESQGIWIANLADEYAFKIELVGSPEISMKQRFELASRIAKCVSAMAGIGDDNALFAPGNSVRSVISTMELKRLELEQQRDDLLAAIDTMLNGASLVDIGNDCGIGVEDSDLESFNAVVNRIKAGAK